MLRALVYSVFDILLSGLSHAELTRIHALIKMLVLKVPCRTQLAKGAHESISNGPGFSWLLGETTTFCSYVPVHL